MRLKTEAYKEIMQEKGLTTDQICKSTGLSEFSLNWILDNGGFTSDGTLKALAIVAGVELKSIVRPDPSDNVENGIEFIRDAKTATVQFCQRRCSYQVWKCSPAARYLIYGVGQQGKRLLSAGHRYLQIINQGSFQKPGIVYLLFFRNPFQPCRKSDVCLDALVIFFHAE